MFNDDDPVFNATDTIWIQRIAADSLEHGEDWENPEKRKTTARLLRESSAANEQHLKQRTPLTVLSMKDKAGEKK